jgi:hypothetical protein
MIDLPPNYVRAVGKMIWDPELPAERAIPFDNDIQWDVSSHSEESHKNFKQLFETERTKEEILESINILDEQVHKSEEAPKQIARELASVMAPKQIARESASVMAPTISSGNIMNYSEVQEETIAPEYHQSAVLKKEEVEEKKVHAVVKKKPMETRRASAIIFLHPVLVSQSKKSIFQAKSTIVEQDEPANLSGLQSRKSILQSELTVPKNPPLSDMSVLEETEDELNIMEVIKKGPEQTNLAVDMVREDDNLVEAQPRKQVAIAPDGVLPNSNRTAEAKKWFKTHKKDENVLQEVKMAVRIPSSIRKKPAVSSHITSPLTPVAEQSVIERKHTPPKAEKKPQSPKKEETIEETMPVEPEPPIRIPEIVIKVSQTNWFPIDDVNFFL